MKEVYDKKKKVFLVLKIIFIILIVLSANALFSWHNEKKEILRELDSVDDLLTKEYVEGEMVYTLDKRINYHNKDTVAWLIVEGTRINYPVVQTTNNNYYLNHNYLEEKSSAGWIFMDSDNKLTDQNIIIYGHHRKDGIMFGDIDKLMKKKYYKDHDGKITLVIGEENRVYQVFSVYEAKADDMYNKNNYSDFEDALTTFKEKSIIDFDTDLTGVKEIITLSTCHNNNKDRLVVQAYRKMS